MNWTVRPYDLPLAVPYRWAKGEQRRRRGWLVTDGQHWGEIAEAPHLPPPLAADVMQASGGWQDAPARIRCGYATASLTSDESLATTLARPHGLPVSASVEVNALLTEDRPVDEAEQAWEAGHRTFKIKVGTGNDERRVAAIRDALPDAAIRLDANDASVNLEALAAYDIEYIEDPGVVTSEHVPVAIDAAATDLAAIRSLLEQGVERIILKPQRLGGPDRAAEAISLCRDEGVAVTVTNSLETTIGLHAALHVAALVPGTAHGLGTARYFATDVGATPDIVDGRMNLPKAGLGVTPW